MFSYLYCKKKQAVCLKNLDNKIFFTKFLLLCGTSYFINGIFFIIIDLLIRIVPLHIYHFLDLRHSLPSILEGKSRQILSPLKRSTCFNVVLKQMLFLPVQQILQITLNVAF